MVGVWNASEPSRPPLSRRSSGTQWLQSAFRPPSRWMTSTRMAPMLWDDNQALTGTNRSLWEPGTAVKMQKREELSGARA